MAKVYKPETQEIYRNRAAVREAFWVYARDEFTGRNWRVDLTYRDDSVSAPPSDHAFGNMVQRALANFGMDSVWVIERPKWDDAGRVHAHTIMHGERNKIDALTKFWNARFGFTHVDEVIDLLESVRYITKAVMPVSTWGITHGGKTNSTLPLTRAAEGSGKAQGWEPLYPGQTTPPWEASKQDTDVPILQSLRKQEQSLRSALPNGSQPLLFPPKDILPATKL